MVSLIFANISKYLPNHLPFVRDSKDVPQPSIAYCTFMCLPSSRVQTGGFVVAAALTFPTNFKS